MKEDHRSAETQPFQLWKKIFLWQMHSDNLIISCNDALYNSSELPVSLSGLKNFCECQLHLARL